MNGVVHVLIVEQKRRLQKPVLGALIEQPVLAHRVELQVLEALTLEILLFDDACDDAASRG